MIPIPVLKEPLAFRGDTALHKPHFRPPGRYSEDTALVQVCAEPAGAILEYARTTLNPWLGEPDWEQTQGHVALDDRFTSESPRGMLGPQRNEENNDNSRPPGKHYPRP